MKENLKEIFKGLENEDTIEQLFSILELPDEKFNQIYPDFLESLKNVFNSEAMKNQMQEQLKFTPISNLDEELENLKQTIEEIKQDDSLSENKKDILITLINSSKELVLNILKNPRAAIEVKVQKINDNAILPTYAHDTDAGADIYAIEDIVLKPHTTEIIKTGLKVSIPVGYMINIAPRSGLSAKTALRIANPWGIIDSKRG